MVKAYQPQWSKIHKPSIIGIILFILGIITIMSCDITFVIRQPYWAAGIKVFLIGFWLFLIFRKPERRQRSFSSKVFVYALSGITCTMFGLVVSIALVNTTLIAVMNTETIQLKATLVEKDEPSQHDREKNMIGFYFESEPDVLERIFVTGEVYEQLTLGDEVIISLQESGDLLYYAGGEIRLVK